jgi:hypothetical protein
MPKFLSLKNNIDSLIAAIAGFTIIYFYTRHGGIGLCPDGVVYTTTAAQIVKSGNMIDFQNYSMVQFPAFYPLFLSGLMILTGLKPLVFGAMLNAFLFAVIIYISGYIMGKFAYRSKWYKWAILSCIVLSPGLLEVYSMLWSETIFILMILLFFITMHRYFQTYSIKVLIAASLIASVAAVTRYAGVTIIGAGFIFLILDMKRPILQKIQHVVLYCVVSPILLIINLTRNYFVEGTMTGHREKAIKTLTDNMHDAGSVFYNWLPFFNGHYGGAAWATLLIVCILLFICYRQFIRNRRLVTFENMAAVFVLIYVSFMVIVPSISRMETLDSRFLSPCFIPLLWSLSNRIVPISQKINAPDKKWIFISGILIFSCFQYGQISADYETWDGVKDAGIPGYTEDGWKLSPTVLFMEKDSLPFKKGYTIYSDAYDAVYFFTRWEGKFLPHRQNKSQVSDFLKDPHCYVIWFDDGEDHDLVGKNFIINVKKMKLARQFDDGAIYEYSQ